MAGILRNIRMDGVSMKEFLNVLQDADFPMIKDMYCGGDYYALYLTDEAGFEKRKIGGNNFTHICGAYNYTSEGSISSSKPHHWEIWRHHADGTPVCQVAKFTVRVAVDAEIY